MNYIYNFLILGVNIVISSHYSCFRSSLQNGMKNPPPPGTRHMLSYHLEVLKIKMTLLIELRFSIPLFNTVNTFVGCKDSNKFSCEDSE